MLIRFFSAMVMFSALSLQAAQVEMSLDEKSVMKYLVSGMVSNPEKSSAEVISETFISAQDEALRHTFGAHAAMVFEAAHKLSPELHEMATTLKECVVAIQKAKPLSIKDIKKALKKNHDEPSYLVSLLKELEILTFIGKMPHINISVVSLPTEARYSAFSEGTSGGNCAY